MKLLAKNIQRLSTYSKPSTTRIRAMVAAAAPRAAERGPDDTQGAQKRRRIDHEANETDPLPRERAVGITEYLQTRGPAGPLWTGFLKERFGDFIVHEVALDGSVAKISDTSAASLAGFFEQSDAEKPVPMTSEEREKALGALVGEEAMAGIRVLLACDPTLPAPAPVTCGAVNERPARTQVHLLVKAQFAAELETTTDQDGCLVVMRRGGSGGRPSGRRGPDWKGRGVSCCQFFMYKENRDTMDAIHYISRHLKIPAKAFSYAGTKDKRACTTQAVTAFRVTADRLAQFGRLKNSGIVIGNFSYRPAPLQLGDLGGNRFTLCIREACSDSGKSAIAAALEAVRTRGFINYFGLQRFGTRVVPTNKVGAALLRQEWEAAARLILDPRGTPEVGRESGPTAHGRTMDGLALFAATGDAQSALEKTSVRAVAERAILGHLALPDKRQDYATAIARIPRNMRTLYVRAFQSYVWNTAASRRIQLYGSDRVVVGDLFLCGELGEVEEVEEGSSRSTPAVRVVASDEEAAACSIDRVVLPLPGYSVEYPTHDVLDIYRDLLAEASLDISDMRRSIRDYSLPGAYRTLFAIPGNLEWSFVAYNDVTEQLTATDRMVANGEAPCSGTDGKNLAVVLSFTLSSSQYATMLLREASLGGVVQEKRGPQADLPKQDEPPFKQSQDE